MSPVKEVFLRIVNSASVIIWALVDGKEMSRDIKKIAYDFAFFTIDVSQVCQGIVVIQVMLIFVKKLRK